MASSSQARRGGTVTPNIDNIGSITSADESWAAWFDGRSVSSDFMAERSQSADQLRDVVQ